MSFMAKRYQKTKGRARRRVWPIHAYVGPNGSGKSVAAVWDSMRSLESGRPVLSTVRLLDWQNSRLCDGWMGEDDLTPCPSCNPDGPGVAHFKAHPLWRPLSSWSSLLEAEHCDVILDEVTGVASSRESAGMPAAVANFLVQLRRRDVVLRWTAPAWTRADLIVRELTQAVTDCRGFLPMKETLTPDGEDQERLWRPRRLFRWRTYDATQFEEWSMGKAEQIKPFCRELYWGPSSPVFKAYDTLDAVLSIGHVLDSGRCAGCGGRRTAPACSCADYAGRKAPARGRGSGAPAKHERGADPDAPVPSPAVAAHQETECSAPALSALADDL